ncbi:MAG: hypothetical protein ACT4P2_11065 [Pseudomonadota bacterium]
MGFLYIAALVVAVDFVANVSAEFIAEVFGEYLNSVALDWFMAGVEKKLEPELDIDLESLE